MMLFIKALHIVAVVAWFAALFYLPRLFVYHADARDEVGIKRFKLMEQRLYYQIMWPAALLTTGFGFWLVFYNPNYYFKAGWFHAKLTLVLLLWGYHAMCGHHLRQFKSGRNRQSARYYRIFNEIPTLVLLAVVLLVVIKP